MKDIRRLFQYHGAEHKTIFCYENQEPLTVENVRKHIPVPPPLRHQLFDFDAYFGDYPGIFHPNAPACVADFDQAGAVAAGDGGGL